MQCNMFPNRYRFLIWLSIPIMVYSQYTTEVYNADITTTESIPQSNTEHEIIPLIPYHEQNQYAICNRSNTCTGISIGDLVEENSEDLRSRSCTCDENCSIYDECCPDAKYQNRNQSDFLCVETYFDGNIYMKRNTCKSTNDNHVSNLCVKHSIIDKNDTIFTIPVTSTNTNYTYPNVFCALCNNEKKFRFWDVVIVSSTQSETTTLQIDVTLERDKLFLNDLSRGLINNYTIHTKIPKLLHPRIRYCVPKNEKNCHQNNRNEITTLCLNTNVNNLNESFENSKNCSSISNTDNSDVHSIKAKHLPFDYCDVIPDQNSAYRMFCKKYDLELFQNNPELTYIDQCFYQTIDGEICQINYFFQSDEFKLIDSETVYVYKYKRNFSSVQWSLESNSSMYLCGTEKPQTSVERFFSNVSNFLKNILIGISIFFLAAYIIMYNHIRSMRYPFSRVIFSYSLTLLVTSVIYLMANWLSSCRVISALLHYLFLSCFAWLMVASFECWRTVTAPTSMRSNKESTWTRFGIYCLVGWISPLTIMSVAIYFELSSIQSIPCNLKPGYGRLNYCFISQTLPSLYFFHYPSIIMFLINMYFFIHISVYVFCNSSVHRNYSIFAKLALVTGIPWTIETLVRLTDGFIILQLIYVILNSSQGIFIFFVFAYNKELFKDGYNKLYSNFFKKSQTRTNAVAAYRASVDTQASHITANEYI